MASRVRPPRTRCPRPAGTAGRAPQIPAEYLAPAVKGENTGEYCAPGCVASCDAKACVRADWVGDETCDTDEGSMLTCYNNDNGDCEEDGP